MEGVEENVQKKWVPTNNNDDMGRGHCCLTCYVFDQLQPQGPLKPPLQDEAVATMAFNGSTWRNSELRAIWFHTTLGLLTSVTQ